MLNIRPQHVDRPTGSPRKGSMKRLLCVSALLVLIASPALLQKRAVAQAPAAAGTRASVVIKSRDVDHLLLRLPQRTVKAGGLALGRPEPRRRSR